MATYTDKGAWIVILYGSVYNQVNHCPKVRMNMKELKKYLGTIFVSISGVILVLSAWVHNVGINESHYTTSPLIGVEMSLLICFSIFLIFQPILAIFFLFKRQWRSLGFVVVNTVLGMFFVAMAISLDAATLIYMT
jgi:hypothetical protein